MARHGLSRPAGTIQYQEPPTHGQWRNDRFTGSLKLALEIPEGQFVSPSTGRLTLTTPGREEVVAQEAARAAGRPVIPGSGIKGAVRTIYELLSFSCDPFARSNCKPQWCCDACSLFGRLGRSGRASFEDAVSTEKNPVRIEVRDVPMPWNPQKATGDVSLYDLQKAKELDPDRKVFVERTGNLSREVFLGTFETRLTFWNATREELGRLLLCMGIGSDVNTGFFLRLGGVKYDGKGAVVVRPREITLASPGRKRLEGDRCLEETTGWIQSAQASAWAATFWPKLTEVAELLRSPSR